MNDLRTKTTGVRRTVDLSALILGGEADRLRLIAREVGKQGSEMAAEILERAAAFILQATPAARTRWRRAWRFARSNKWMPVHGDGLYVRAAELWKQRWYAGLSLPHHLEAPCEDCHVPVGTPCLADCPGRLEIRESQGPRAELRQCGGRSAQP